MRELGDILARTWHQPPKQRERHILPKTLPRVTGPNKAALKLLVLVSRLLVKYNLRRNLIQSVYSGNLYSGSEKEVLHCAGSCMKSWGHDAQVMRALAAI